MHPGFFVWAGHSPTECEDLLLFVSPKTLLIAEDRVVLARVNASSRDRENIVIRGIRNVFADLGYPDAEERQAKLRLAYALNQVLEQRKLTQAEAAKALGVTQPKISALRHYKLAGFSMERLMTLLTALDQDVEIVIRRKPASRRAARIRVEAA